MFVSSARATLSIPFAALLLCSLAACSATPSQGENARNTQMSEDPAPSPPPASGTSPSNAAPSKTEQLENPEMIQDPAGAPPSKGVSARNHQMENASTPDAGGTCDAAKVQSSVGETATQPVVDKIVAGSASRSARVIKPGMMVTMDYRQDRVNIHVDAANVITSIKCG